jgi:amidohydrolase
MADWREEIDHYLISIDEELVATRRFLHAHPEPSREEYRTTEFLAAKLGEVGIPRRLIPSRRGVIAEPETNDRGPKVAFRADIDALRIHDLKDVAYRSTREGTMHACGHDAHATMALGAALALWQCREHLPWPVPWRAVFQPAEETGEGAREMIAEGAVEAVRAIIALHVDPELPVGQIAQRVGVMTAFCQDLSVTIRGVGGHSARPHQSADPIAAAVQFVSAVYQLIPRSVDAREAAVVTFGTIHAGESPNAIPEQVDLGGTVRTMSWEAATVIEGRLRQIARGVSESGGVSVDIQLLRGVDAVVNDPEVTAVCTRAAEEIVGAGRVVTIPLPSMGGEDFSGYLAHAPGCLLRIGVASEDRPKHFLHSAHFDIDERSLSLGARLMARSIVLLSKPEAQT